MKHEELGKYQSSDCLEGGDEDRLFGESVYDDEDGGRFPIKSMEMEFHGHFGMGSCFNSP